METPLATRSTSLLICMAGQGSSPPPPPSARHASWLGLALHPSLASCRVPSDDGSDLCLSLSLPPMRGCVACGRREHVVHKILELQGRGGAGGRLQLDFLGGQSWAESSCGSLRTSDGMEANARAIEADSQAVPRSCQVKHFMIH